MSLGSMARVAVLSLILTGCQRSPSSQPTIDGDIQASQQKLVEARAGFHTSLRSVPGEKSPVDQPPPGIFRVVKYQSPVGPLSAYLTPDNGDGMKKPAIIWITGGDCNSIGDVWGKMSKQNDQTASAFREAGLVMLFPSLRGGNDNPGVKEGFLGEVDDVLAAAGALEKLPYVDKDRIYLGGHSTGGTLVFLVAACTNRFRAVFSFGPVDSVAGYPDEFIPFNKSIALEVKLRSPIYWTQSVQCPLFLFEGTNGGNVGALNHISTISKNPLIHCFPVDGYDHFSILYPLTHLLAKKINADVGPKINISFGPGELTGR